MRETYPEEDAKAFREGLSRDKSMLQAIKESVEDYGLPNSKPQTASKTSQPQFNVYLTQSQSQEVKNTIEIDQLDPDVKDRLTELLSELEKKSGKDTGKIVATVKWLADHAIDVLIALIAARHN